MGKWINAGFVAWMLVQCSFPPKAGFGKFKQSRNRSGEDKFLDLIQSSDIPITAIFCGTCSYSASQEMYVISCMYVNELKVSEET